MHRRAGVKLHRGRMARRPPREAFFLLAVDVGGSDIASEATWTDKYRNSDRDTTRVRCEGTRQWHFVDIEVAAPNLDAACFGHLPLPAGVLASEGSPQACVVDKFEQFAGELGDPTTGAPERLLALKFLLHLVGDVHQPLHAADDHDAGGNRKLAAAEGSTPATFIASGIFSSSSAWGPTRVKSRPT